MVYTEYHVGVEDVWGEVSYNLTIAAITRMQQEEVMVPGMTLN